MAPKWQTEVTNQLNNDKITFEFVRVGFDKVDDKDVTLTDEDYKNYLAKNSGKYTLTDENRLIDYVAFNVTPSLQDTQDIIAKLRSLRSEFRSTTNDSLFSVSKGGAVLPAYQKADAITGALKDSIANMSIGSVAGPYLDNGAYLLAKLIDRKVMPDSVKARHILRKADSPAALAVAKKQIDSLKNLLVTKRARFDSLAIKNSEDTGSAIKGGDLGTFAEGVMVKPFNDACFNGSIGSYYVVETQFGVHLIEVQNQKYLNKNPKYKIAIVAEPMIPSQNTQNAVYDKVSGILSKCNNIDDLKKLGEKDPELKIQTTKGLVKNDYIIQPFQGDASRDIIKWAFNANAGKISKDIYNFQDENKQYTKTYVLAGLNSISKPGLMSLVQAKSQIEAQVKNFKKAEILKTKIKGTDMNAIASEFGTVIDTATNVTFAQGAIASIRASEPKLIAKAFDMEPGKTSGIIEGTSGLFMIKVKEKTPAIPESNLDMIKSSIVNSAKSGAAYRVWDALKKKYKPEDNRSSFY
jgi:peptidyl-prolyl cis-trans isomerase D